MGLHLNYELRLPASATADDVGHVLAELRTRAGELPFAEVSPLVRLTPDKGRRHRRRTAWLEFWASLVAAPYDDDDPPLTGDPRTAQGFLVNAGRGCETAIFALMRRSDASGSMSEWFWICNCKTQYASVVSDAHLVACHTSLVALLDRAIELGIDVVVRDETTYWETRDERRLIAEVGSMNRIVAAFTGRLADALGAEHRVEAPIFEHRRFERLEMGQRMPEGDDD